MATGGYSPGVRAESEFEIDYISPDELASMVDVGNDQTWLSCLEGSDPQSYVDLKGFLLIRATVDDRERLYRALLEQESSKSGGIDTRTFTRPKKPSAYHPLPKVSELGRNTSFLPSGGVNNRYNYLSKAPVWKDNAGLKDVTNSAFDMNSDKINGGSKYPNFDDWSLNMTDQAMISEMSFHSFVSISDSDDGMTENIPNVSAVKYKEPRSKPKKSVSEKTPERDPDFQPSYISTPATKPPVVRGSSYEILDRSNSPSPSPRETLNRTMELDKKDGFYSKLKYSPSRTLQQPNRERARSNSRDLLDDHSNDESLYNSFPAYNRSDPRNDRTGSPKFSPNNSGLRRLSYNNTFRLSKTGEPKHFKSVESGLNSTYELPDHTAGRAHKELSLSGENAYSSVGNLQRSLGDVHLAAQQQEYQLRDDTAGPPSVPLATLKSPMKKVLSETCIFSPKDDVKLRVTSNHHSSVSNLNANSNKDNNNQPAGFSSKLSSAASKKNLVSGLPVSTRPNATKPRSKIPSRLPTRMPTRMQTKTNSDWTEGCY